MVLKIRNRENKKQVKYKSSKNILTPKDIEEADIFDSKLNSTIAKIEDILLKKNILSKDSLKKDPLMAWYIIGTEINKFLNNNKLSRDDENLFWENLYGRSVLLNKNTPKNKVSATRNDFKTASILANYDLGYISKINSWAIWREMIRYKVFQDKRIIDWLIQKLTEKPRTRDQARPLLKAVVNRFKRIDTNILSEEELQSKLKEIQSI